MRAVSPDHPDHFREKRARALRISRTLAATYPDARCGLDFENPFELLTAVILSAQTTDARVNQVMPGLRARYPDSASLAAASPESLEKLLRPLGFFRSKAKALREMAAAIVERHGGQVPQEMEALTALHGVGRKTANVVLGECFTTVGVTVDTHVKRLAWRMGLTASRDPLQIERDLMQLLPREEWTPFAHRIIRHGRQVCRARKPQCDQCVVRGDCPRVSDP